MAEQPKKSMITPPAALTTAEQVWSDIEAKYKGINELIASLPADEKANLRERFQTLVAQEVPKWWTILLQEMTPDQFTEHLVRCFAAIGQGCTEQTFAGIKTMTARIEAKVKDHFTVKPRMVERDKEIVRLHEEGKSFGQIALKLKASNPQWVGKNGKPLATRTVAQAYRRARRLLDKTIATELQA